MIGRIKTTTGYRVEKDVMVPTRDGRALATDLRVPGGGEPAPALSVRAPYGKDAPNLPGSSVDSRALLGAGYAVAHRDGLLAVRSELTGTELPTGAGRSQAAGAEPSRD